MPNAFHFTGALDQAQAFGLRSDMPRQGERPVALIEFRADAGAIEPVMASRTSVSGSTVCAKGLTAGRAATRNGGASPGLTEAASTGADEGGVSRSAAILDTRDAASASRGAAAAGPI